MRHDPRLDLSNTTPDGAQQYRMWFDSNQIFVPRSQNTSPTRNGLQSENVGANIRVGGEINQGVFMRPLFTATNTPNDGIFDEFYLSTYRTRAQLPDNIYVSDATQLHGIYDFNITTLNANTFNFVDQAWFGIDNNGWYSSQILCRSAIGENIGTIRPNNLHIEFQIILPPISYAGVVLNTNINPTAILSIRRMIQRQGVNEYDIFLQNQNPNFNWQAFGGLEITGGV
jgi:hypothetical protein